MKLATALLAIIVLLSPATGTNSQTPVAGLQTKPIGVGDAVPNFTLADQDGHKVTLSDARNKTPVVLIFYRGYW